MTPYHSAFGKVHEHSHADLHKAQKYFNHNYYIPVRQKIPLISIHDCIDCPMQSAKI